MKKWKRFLTQWPVWWWWFFHSKKKFFFFKFLLWHNIQSRTHTHMHTKLITGHLLLFVVFYYMIYNDDKCSMHTFDENVLKLENKNCFWNLKKQKKILFWKKHTSRKSSSSSFVFQILLVESWHNKIDFFSCFSILSFFFLLFGLIKPSQINKNFFLSCL